MSNNPNIRFKQFNGEWETKRLGECGDFYTGLSGKTKEDFGHGKGKYITYMNVYTNPVTSLQMTEAIEIDTKQNAVKKGDIFFTTSSETPDEVGMTSVLNEEMPNTYLNSFCFGFRPKIDAKSLYLAYFLRSIFFRKEICLLAQGISRFNISKSKVKKLNVLLPSTLLEQERIAGLFSGIDATLEQHKQKLQHLQHTKATMLTKLFPQNNQTTPQIRFKGFTGEWEMKKFENFYKFAAEGSTPSTTVIENYKNGKIPFVKIEDTENKYIFDTKNHITELGLNSCSTWLIPANNILFTNGATIGNVAINKIPVTTKQGILGIVLKNNYNIEFIYYLLFGNNFQNEVKKRQAGGTFATIILKNLNEISLLLPPTLLEQERIAGFFSHLDSLIAEQERLIEKIENIKQTLLAKCFI